MSTYVLNDIEVKLTGRIAQRQAVGKTQELVEVTPAREDDGTWKRWVNRSSLFEIKEPAS